MIEKLKARAKALKREAYALYIAAGDPRVPWYAKAFMGLVLAYTFSPIDLIPDFIPVIGYLDDLIIVPLGIALALKMIPPQVLSDARNRVDELLQQGKPVIRGGAVIIIAIWLTVVGAVFLFVLIKEKK
ncbi:MAG: YkvA family protein [Anaerolineaceae bacterium]